MSPADHNKTLVIIYLLLGGFFTLPLMASPWILAKNVDQYPSPRRGEQILIAVLIAAVVLTLATLFWSTALGLYRRRSWGRRVALVSSVVFFPLCPPIAGYTWWFMHSEGGKQLYERVRTS
jgi:chromate transport protein ChrA